MAHYAYDYTGERVLKSLITGGIVNTNSQGQSVLSLDAPTVYVNPYYIASHYDETVLISKHYYMANQRIASALSHQDDTTGFVPSVGYEEGNRSFSTDAIVVDIEASLDCLYGEDVDLDWEQMLAPVSLGEGILFNGCDGSEADIVNPYLSLRVSDSCACAQSTYWASQSGVDCSVLPTMYFYHPDYLGSVEFVTDMSGDPYQFFLNTIWGENLQNQLAFNTTAFSSRFRFNGKEWDEETGNFYYGARYYDPMLSVWLSVDPRTSEMPTWSPYVFSFNNPVKFVDPDGRKPYLSGGLPKAVITEIKNATSKSNRFKSLMLANQLTLSNINQTVKSSNRSFYSPEHDQIALNVLRSPSIAVISLTHELTNRSKEADIVQLRQKLLNFEISPEEYALGALAIEGYGYVNKVIVASELKLKSTGDTYTDYLLSEYNAGNMTEQDILNDYMSQLQNVIIKDTGLNAIDTYVNRAQKMQDDVQCTYEVWQPYLELIQKVL